MFFPHIILKILSWIYLLLPPLCFFTVIQQCTHIFSLRIYIHKGCHNKESSMHGYCVIWYRNELHCLLIFVGRFPVRKVTYNVALLTRDIQWHCQSIVVGFKCDQMTNGSVRNRAYCILYFTVFSNTLLQLSFVGCRLPSVGFEWLAVYLLVYFNC
jgi:hypothetical protein